MARGRIITIFLCFWGPESNKTNKKGFQSSGANFQFCIHQALEGNAIFLFVGCRLNN